MFEPYGRGKGTPISYGISKGSIRLSALACEVTPILAKFLEKFLFALRLSGIVESYASFAA